MSQLGTIIKLKLTNTKQLKQLHAQIILNNLHHQNHYRSHLIAHCTRLHSPPPYARLIFDSIPYPNGHLYTNMIKYYYYSQLGDPQNEVFTLFRETRDLGIDIDFSVYPILIKSVGRASCEIHGHMIKMGIWCEIYVRNVILNMYARYGGQVEVARKVFDEMCDKVVADWNSMICGYWYWGCEAEACRMFEEMPKRNVVSWTAMVSGYAKMKDLKRAREYFDEIPDKNVVSWNAMLSGYAQNGFSREAVDLFYKMIGEGVKPNEKTWVGVVSSCSSIGDPVLADLVVKLLDDKNFNRNYFVKTALLDMHAKCGNIEAARRIFDGLGVKRTSVSWSAMISAYARIGDLAYARELFDKAPKGDIIIWNPMITGYAQNGQAAKAIELFQDLVKIGLKPDEVTMVSVISACGNLGALELGKWVVNIVKENRIQLSISGYNSLIFMYSKCGSMKDAVDVFDHMSIRDVISHNTVITGFAAHGHGTKALELLTKMKKEGIEPDRVTYIGVLTACSHAGLLIEGRKLFDSIKNPEVDHYACMVDMLGRVGKLDEAMKYVKQMPMKPHAGVYGSILNASRIHKRLDLGELAASKLFELEPHNSGNYILLSNIYACNGKWEDVDRIRKAMRKLGVRKATGWSWVEHKGKMHKFIVGDQSHERSKEIYGVLIELRKKMRVYGYIADKSCVLRDVEEEEKEEMVGTHSEKLAIAFALLVIGKGEVIRVVKNLRVCLDCHTAIKVISKIENREIIVRDNNRFHCFSNGMCSCNDYW